MSEHVIDGALRELVSEALAAHPRVVRQRPELLPFRKMWP
jgi:hypothetical protein